MTKNTINFDDIPTTEFEILPEDRYILEVVEATLTDSKAGNKKIATQFAIVQNENESFNNRRVWTDFSLVQKAWFNIKNYFDAAGVSIDGEEVKFEDLPEMLKGSQVSAFISIDTYNGKQSNKVAEWKPVGAGDSMFK